MRQATAPNKTWQKTNRQFLSWESKGAPQEITPYPGVINHHCPLIIP